MLHREMAMNSAQGDSAMALPSSSVAGSAGDVALPRLAVGWSRVRVPRAWVALGPVPGRIALASLVVCAVVLVLFSTSGPSPLVPRSNEVFPGWFAGPVHLLSSGLPRGVLALSYGLSVLLVVMLLAYAVLLASARSLSTRVIVICIVSLHVILLMTPPLQLTDVFNYLGYARL